MGEMTDETGDAENEAQERVESIMSDLDDLVEGRDQVAFGEIVDTLGARGHGPLLMVSGALLMLPIAMVPGLPAIIGLVVILVGVEIFRADKGIWLPGPLKNRKLPADRLERSLDKARPWMDRFRGILGHRLTPLAEHRASVIAVAVITAISGIAIIVAGFIPGLPFILAIHILLFGIGLTARDGLLILAGYLWLIPALALAAYFA